MNISPEIISGAFARRPGADQIHRPAIHRRGRRWSKTSPSSLMKLRKAPGRWHLVRWFIHLRALPRVAESDMHLRPDAVHLRRSCPGISGEDAHCPPDLRNVYTPDGQPFQGDPRAVLSARPGRGGNRWVFATTPGLSWNFSCFTTTRRWQSGAARARTTAPTALTPFDMAGGTAAANDLPRWRPSASRSKRCTTKARTASTEIDFRYSDALTTADSAITLRVALKVIAQKNGLYCTFLPKPIRGINGSGMHVHQSLAYLATEQNVFADPGDAARLIQNCQALHRRSACARAWHVRHPGPVGQFVQTPGRRI